jgi:hypothetical protein
MVADIEYMLNTEREKPEKPEVFFLAFLPEIP